jgi:hypothetical protein
MRLWTKANHGVGRQVPATTGNLWWPPRERPGIRLIILPSVGETPKKRNTQSGQPQFFVLGGTRANGRHG